MSSHDQFAEDLALCALGSLQGSEMTALEAHLQQCPVCRLELEKLRGDMALLALATAGSTPPQRARQRLLQAIAREPRPHRDLAGRPWWMPVPWVIAAAFALFALVLWRDNSYMHHQLVNLRNEATQQAAELTRAKNVVSTLTATDALRVTLVAAKTPPQPQGKAIYVRDRSSLIFLASNMPKLPPNKAYELWLLPTQGAPIPAGVFTPDSRGSAAVINPPLPSGVEAKAFAITIEPAGGSSAPTMPIAMMGSGE